MALRRYAKRRSGTEEHGSDLTRYGTEQKITAVEEREMVSHGRTKVRCGWLCNGSDKSLIAKAARRVAMNGEEKERKWRDAK